MNDARKARDLFNDEVSAFVKLDDDLKEIYFRLLGSIAEFKAFFRAVDYAGVRKQSDSGLISRIFQSKADVKDTGRQCFSDVVGFLSGNR